MGGAAAIAHRGYPENQSARSTQRLDIVYRRTPQNLASLVAALATLKSYLRGAPPGLPFICDTQTLQRGLNFTLVTSLGDHSIYLYLFGTICQVLSLPS